MAKAGMIREWEKDEAAFQYEQREGRAILLLWKGAGSTAHIPEEVDGCPVREIGRKAFLSNKRIQEVYLPGSIEMIDDWAFAYCSKLSRIWMPRHPVSFGKGVFLQCERLGHFILEDEKTPMSEKVKECTGALLAAVVHKLDAPYLLNPMQAGRKSWIRKWDTRLMEIMTTPDEDGYSRTILCGEEDIGSMDNNLEFFLHQKRRSKVRLALLRLLYDQDLPSAMQQFLTDYLKSHAKGCLFEETWQVVKEEHGTEKEYYDLLLDIGALTAENFDAVLCDMGTELAEMKAYLLREKEERFGDGEFFSSLSLDL